MAVGTNDITQLALSKPDGSGLTRIEAEKELWDKCKIVHNMRLLASYHFGLENRFALGMTPTSIIHWLLDEMIRKRMIAGELIGVQPELESDTSYFTTYIQRLGVFVQNGQALMPKEGEGIDMGDFQHQMPPQNPNGQQQPGQQQFAPPPPPPMGYGPQGGYAPAAQPQPQFAAPPQQQYAAPPQPQFGAPPQGASQFAAPPQQPPPGFGAPPQGAPGFGPPQGMPPAGPPQQAAPQGAPPAPPAQAPSNRRRGKAEGAAAAPQAAPAQPSLPFAGGPQQQPPGFGQPPQMPSFGPPQGQQAPQPMAQQGGGNTAALEQQVAQLSGQVATLTKMIGELSSTSRIVDVALGYIMRAYFNKAMPQQQAELGISAAFKEIGIPIPT